MNPSSNDMWIGPLTFVVVGFLILGTCIPLILHKVPMNHFYGVRIRESFSSVERWYEINEYGGRLLACGSCAIILTGAAGFFAPSRYFSWYAAVATVVVLVSVLLPVAQTIWWARGTR
jgi:SdpI/YfhL protein family